MVGVDKIAGVARTVIDLPITCAASWCRGLVLAPAVVDMCSLPLAAVVGVFKESPGEVEGVHTGVGG